MVGARFSVSGKGSSEAEGKADLVEHLVPPGCHEGVFPGVHLLHPRLTSSNVEVSVIALRLLPPGPEEVKATLKTTTSHGFNLVWAIE